MKHETVLPKNIRQIGEIQQDKKVYLEDYVMTYIQKKVKAEEEGCAGILTGRKEEGDGCRYVFVKGAVLLDQETEPEKRWEKLEEERQKYFPDQDVVGYFVLGTLDEAMMRENTGELLKTSPVIFHIQEGEETVYWSEENQYQRLKGYFVFYERNPQMQKYMAERETPQRVEEEEGSSDKAIVSFRKKVKEKSGRKAGGWRYLASSFLVLTILMLGVTIINNYDRMKSMEAAITQISLEQEKEQEKMTLVQAAAAKKQTSQSTVEGENQEAMADNVQSQSTLTGNDGQGGDMAAASSGNVQSGDAAAASAGAALEDLLGETILSANGTAGASQGNQTGTNVATDGSALAGNGETNNEGMDGGTAQDTEKTGGSAETAGQVNPVSSGAVLPDSGSAKTAQALAERNYSAEDVATVNQNSADGLASSADRLNRAAYTVKYGDTLADISQKYYGTLEKVEEICRLNNIDDANMIVPGQKIVLP